MNSEFPTYGFKLDFFDERAELVRPYVLQFYTQNDEIELFDVRNHRMFLKKTTNHPVKKKDLYIGNKLLINGRQYEIIDYSDEFTKRAFSVEMQHTYAMLKPGFHNFLGEAIERILAHGLNIINLRMGHITKETAAKFYQEHQVKPFYDQLVQYITSGPVVAMELVGNNAISVWRNIIGPTNIDTAKREAPNSLRALYAKDTTENFAHGSDAIESAKRELDIIFGQRSVQLCCQMNDSTLCVIRPHAVKEGLHGSIIRQITQAGFTITACQMTTIDLVTANEFLEVYRGVVDDFNDMVKQMSAGPLIALEVSRPNAVNEFRQLCGPRDVVVAKQIRPRSLRAQFGTNLVLNGVHCTDLEEDAPLEIEYFFVLLAD